MAAQPGRKELAGDPRREMTRFERDMVELKAAQEKYVYFLLAAAAAAIAYAMQRTNGVTLQAQDWALGIAVSCWALSFFGGCRNGQLVMDSIPSRFLAGVASTVAEVDIMHNSIEPENAAAGRKLVDDLVVKTETKVKNATIGSRRWFNWQFYRLAIGRPVFHWLAHRRYGAGTTGCRSAGRPFNQLAPANAGKR